MLSIRVEELVERVAQCLWHTYSAARVQRFRRVELARKHDPQLFRALGLKG